MNMTKNVRTEIEIVLTTLSLVVVGWLVINAVQTYREVARREKAIAELKKISQGVRIVSLGWEHRLPSVLDCAGL